MPIELDDLLREHHNHDRSLQAIRAALRLTKNRIIDLHHNTDNDILETQNFRSIYDERTDSLLVELKLPKE